MWLIWLGAIAFAIWYLRSKSRAHALGRLIGRLTPGARRQTKPSAPTDAHTYSHDSKDKDAWEGAFYDVVAQRSAKKTVRMQYADGNGNATERDIDIRAYEPQGASGLVIAHCHLRGATRTFRFDRMRQVVDMETGEIIPDLQQLLNDEWKASPEPVLDQLYREHHDVLKILLYMAKADGSVRAAEIGVIAQHCRTITGDDRITADLVKALLQVVDVVTITTFTRLYNKLRRERPEDAANAAQACRAIVATQKTVHPNEQSALDILAKPLPKAAT